MTGNFYRKLRLPPIYFRVLLHAANIRHGTKGFTSLPKESVLRIFFTLKNPTTSAEFESANLCTKGQHVTYRPPKPFIQELRQHINGYFTSPQLTLTGDKAFCLYLSCTYVAVKLVMKTANSLTDAEQCFPFIFALYT